MTLKKEEEEENLLALQQKGSCWIMSKKEDFQKSQRECTLDACTIYPIFFTMCQYFFKGIATKLKYFGVGKNVL